ncbi:hypothetical protein V495_01933 [Pseudogymnoascus sp. VKM F-4514 (FW-929)]|nr:hypothetical protein V495_01933 [Pseudogymnoascus sp. VKM F-4514 (FW-929)]KFY56716.1 hypothetical protein V497_06053 [Pseudogymnoascus sp. VKM F-4516 (FW-969)]
MTTDDLVAPNVSGPADSFDEKGALAATDALESRTVTPENNEKQSLASGKAPNRPDPLSPSFQPKEMQKVVQEAILLAGGAVAILLQVANPGVGQGVNEHSNFAYRPVDRLRTTMTYVYCMAFGTVDEKKTIIDMVHRAHAPVQGATYSADDVHLQLWVAATLYAVGLDITEKIFGKFDDAKANEIYQEYAVLATTLRVPPEMWPVDRQAFWEYWDRMIASFEISAHAVNVGKDLLWNKELPLWAKINMPALRLMTAEWLPPKMRDAYGLKTSKSRQRAYRVLLGVTKSVYPQLPMFIRTYPMKYYMKDMRRRMRNMA